MQINKRGELVTKEVIEIILAVAGIFLIVFLLYSLISPTFDQKEETTKSFLNELEKQIKISDSGGDGRFMMRDLNRDDKIEYFLIYFGELAVFGIEMDGQKIEFSSLENNKNKICICSLEKTKAVCNSCKELGYPAENRGNGEGFILNSNKYISIIKKSRDSLEGGSYYDFAEIE